MTLSYLLIATLIMFVVTFIPRFIPITFLRKKVKSKFLKSFLTYMPYAALTALTFPAVFYSTGNTFAAIIATACALALSFFDLSMTLVALICFGIALGMGFVL